jgi:hypothetical protein
MNFKQLLLLELKVVPLCVKLRRVSREVNDEPDVKRAPSSVRRPSPRKRPMKPASTNTEESTADGEAGFTVVSKKRVTK